MARNMRLCPSRCLVLQRSAALLVVVCLVGAPGCRTSQQTAISNPFLSADRVPAPGSRVPAAGTAQPYYPGQAMPPLPATQQQPALQNQLQPLGALPPSSDITPLPADGSFATAGSSPTDHLSSTGDLLASNSGSVRIPSDDQAMRFSVTTPLAATAASPGVTTPAIANPAALAAQPSAVVQPLAVASRPPVPTPTSFRDDRPAPTAPDVSNWPPAASSAPQVTLSPVSSDGRASGLFRDPQVPAQAPPLYNASPPHSISQPALQPIGQPAGQPTTAPRTRLPGAGEMIREEVVPGSINTTSYQVGMAGGVPGESFLVPPAGFAPNSFTPNPSARPLSDGFRPRGSSRQTSGSGANNPNIPTLRVTPG